jgi:hypothetical protein
MVRRHQRQVREAIGRVECQTLAGLEAPPHGGVGEVGAGEEAGRHVRASEAADGRLPSEAPVLRDLR